MLPSSLSPTGAPCWLLAPQRPGRLVRLMLMLTRRLSPQDFPLLWLDNVVGDQSNVLGFSMLNSSHAFYLDFIRSLNLSWREGCRINPYPGPAVSCTGGRGFTLCNASLSVT